MPAFAMHIAIDSLLSWSLSGTLTNVFQVQVLMHYQGIVFARFESH